MTTAQDGGKVVSLTHRLPLPPGNFLVLISVINFKCYPSIILYRKTADIKTIYIQGVSVE